MNERLKEIRKHMEMNQTDFANLLGVGQSTLAMMEVSKRDISERHIKTICAICGVNEHWFRTGEGEMFEERSNNFDSIARQLNLSAAQLRLVRLVYEMPPEYQDMVLDLARKLVSDEEAESDYDRTIRIASAALDEHDRQLEEPRDGEKRA